MSWGRDLYVEDPGVIAPSLIGFAGPRLSGKSTAACFLHGYGYKFCSFTEPFKSMLRAMLSQKGVDADQVHKLVDGDRKDIPAVDLGGQTPRLALQSLGDWGRKTLGVNIWIDAAMILAETQLNDGGRVVIDRVSTAAEADAIRAHGGAVWQVYRPSIDCDPNHHTEVIDFIVDAVIENTGSLDKFEADVVALLLG